MLSFKKAFTLAEVLITLAIIGIIAAITIPSIIANHQKRTLETQFAKTYNTLHKAVNLAIAEHGSFDTWDWEEQVTLDGQDAFVKKYFAPYLNVVKFCSASNPAGCFPDYVSGTGAKGTPDTRPLPKVVLADGSTLQFLIYSNNGKSPRILAYEVDINGFKKPNVVGLDNFAFNFYLATNEVLPHGTYSNSLDKETGGYIRLTDEEIDEECLNGAGWHCTTKIVRDGFKMNY